MVEDSRPTEYTGPACATALTRSSGSQRHREDTGRGNRDAGRAPRARSQALLGSAPRSAECKCQRRSYRYSLGCRAGRSLSGKPRSQTGSRRRGPLPEGISDKLSRNIGDHRATTRPADGDIADLVQAGGCTGVERGGPRRGNRDTRAVPVAAMDGQTSANQGSFLDALAASVRHQNRNRGVRQ